ncbi:MAG: HAD-IIIC family phosphatase [Polyangiales bacterium]
MRTADRTHLDYFALVRRARRATTMSGSPLRVALLGDCALQQVAPLVRVLLADAGFAAEIYEAGYDTVENEAHDPSSGLFAFRPDVVVIVQATQRLRDRYYSFTGSSAELVDDLANKMASVWRAISERTGAPIVQSTFVVPSERAFGNFGFRAPPSFHTTVQRLNAAIAKLASETPSIYLHDVDYVASEIGRRQFIDEKLWLLSKSLCALEHLPEVAQNLVDVVLAIRGVAAKCVVLDLDNTTWGGVVGDDGIEGIRLGEDEDGPAFRGLQRFAKELSKRGLILAVCSKNTDSVARDAFARHPDMVLKLDDIAVFVANWQDKATNIRHIQETLNIGLDSIVFLDDNPFERNLVRQILPQVIVPELPEDPADYVRAVASLNLFETASASALDADRGRMYADQAKREGERAQFTSLEEYLASLDTKVTVGRFDRFNLPRIVQLTQRSNQFNLTTRRYGEAECERFMNDQSAYPFHVSVRDKYGDFGLVQVAIVRISGADAVIDQFLMSCRVLMRGVEEFAMNRIFETAKARGCTRVVGTFIPTAKNAMVAEFYPRFGFAKVDDRIDDSGGTTTWAHDVARWVPRSTHMEVIEADPTQESAR